MKVNSEIMIHELKKKKIIYTYLSCAVVTLPIILHLYVHLL